MKKIVIALASFLVLLIGCTKEGPAGKDGITGTNGIDGKDGSKIYSGSASPASSIGIVGDFYIDLSNGLLYGPKLSSGWGSGFNIKGKDGTNGVNGTNGKDGTNGEDGTLILSGVGFPSLNTGKVGDFYIDKSSGVLYGPKASVWPSVGLELKGRDGNANVRSYVFSNPWNYYYTEEPKMGLFRFFFSGVFSISSFEAEYGLVLGYIESESGTLKLWSQIGTTHSNFFGSNFNSSFQLVNSDGLMTGAFVKIGKFLNSNSSSADWIDMDEVRNVTGIKRIKIIIIPQSALTVMGFKNQLLDMESIKLLANQFQ